MDTCARNFASARFPAARRISMSDERARVLGPMSLNALDQSLSVSKYTPGERIGLRTLLDAAKLGLSVLVEAAAKLNQAWQRRREHSQVSRWSLGGAPQPARW